MSVPFIISQILVAISYIFTAITYAIKNRRWLLFYSFLSLVMLGASYCLLSAWSGLAMMGLSILRNIIFLIQDKVEGAKGDKITKSDWIVLFVLVAIQIVLSWQTYNGPLSLLSVFATLLYTISIWQKNITIYNILGILCSLAWISYDIYVYSPLAIFCEIILLVVMIVNLILKYVKKMQKHDDFDEIIEEKPENDAKKDKKSDKKPDKK